jgi:tetratricopeptide (TPR) repeat protein
MTLNITVATETRIYQSADYRFTDLVTGEKYDDARNQKIFVAAGNMWIATVCFNGVGRTGRIEVSKWLSDVCAATTREESLDGFLIRLLAADSWLSTASPRNRRHSFVVAAFVGRNAIVSLVSNYERFDGPPAADAARRLAIHQSRPTRPQTFVFAQPRAIARPRRLSLAVVAAETTEPDKVFTALARANQDVARHNEAVSSSCFTAYVARTGEGAGSAHEIDITVDMPLVASMRVLGPLLRSPPDGIDLRGRALKGFTFAHSWSTDEYHAIQLEDKPSSPHAHSNAGVYLLDRKNDIDGAERAFRKALALDPIHANALGNLANVMARRGNLDEADALYRQALKSAPGHENASHNYAILLRRREQPSAQIRTIVESALARHANSGRLHLLLGEVELGEGRTVLALEAFRRARELRADQKAVEADYAVALHMSGAPLNTCIAAYRTAIALNPTNGTLQLNMAQLLFAAGLDDQASDMLRQAWRFELDPSSQLEAHFYSIAHTIVDSGTTASAIQRLLDAGARLNWNVDMTLERVRLHDSTRADLLSELREMLVCRAPAKELVQIVQRLSTRTSSTSGSRVRNP